MIRYQYSRFWGGYNKFGKDIKSREKNLKEFIKTCRKDLKSAREFFTTNIKVKSPEEKKEQKDILNILSESLKKTKFKSLGL